MINFTRTIKDVKHLEKTNQKKITINIFKNMFFKKYIFY